MCPNCKGTEIAYTEEVRKNFKLWTFGFPLMIIAVILHIRLSMPEITIYTAIALFVINIGYIFVRPFISRKSRTKATCKNCHKQWYI